VGSLRPARVFGEGRPRLHACWALLLPLAHGAAGCGAERFRSIAEDSTAGETSSNVTSSAADSIDVSGTLSDAITATHDQGTHDQATHSEVTDDAGLSSSGAPSTHSTVSTEATAIETNPVMDAGSSAESTLNGSTLTRDASAELDASATTSSDELEPSNGTDGGAVVDAGATFGEDSSSVPPPEPGVCNSGDFEPPKQVLGLGFDDKLWGPAISADGSTLYFGHTTTHEDLYRATIQPDRVRTFQDVTPLTTLNTTGNEGTPFITADGLALYYYAVRQPGPGERDLWRASRSSLTEEFGDPKQVMGVNGPSYDHLPWVSQDELTIYYTTERMGGLGRSDVWQATRLSKNMPFTGHRLVPGINTPDREDSVTFSPDRLTVYFSTDRGTTGDLDIWQATRSSRGQSFSNPQPLVHLNSSADDTNLAMTADGKRLYFSSGREGAQRIWVAIRSCQ
jgi:hypothetical protein